MFDTSCLALLACFAKNGPAALYQHFISTASVSNFTRKDPSWGRASEGTRETRQRRQMPSRWHSTKSPKKYCFPCRPPEPRTDCSHHLGLMERNGMKRLKREVVWVLLPGYPKEMTTNGPVTYVTNCYVSFAPIFYLVDLTITFSRIP